MMASGKRNADLEEWDAKIRKLTEDFGKSLIFLDLSAYFYTFTISDDQHVYAFLFIPFRRERHRAR